MHIGFKYRICPASVPPEDVARVDLVLHVVEACVVPVRDDRMARTLELLQAVYHPASEERPTVLECRLVHDYLRALRLDPLHDALDRRLPEVVAVTLHRQAVHPDHAPALQAGLPLAVAPVVPRLAQDLVRDEVLARAVRVDYRLDEVLWNVAVVRKELLRVLREAVPPVAERRVVVVAPDARVQAHPVDDRPGVEPLQLCVRVELVEVAYPQREVRVREQLHGLGLCRPHVQDRDVISQRTLADKTREGVRSLPEAGVASVVPHDDAARVKVVVQRLRLPEELRREDDARPPLKDGPVCLPLTVREPAAHRLRVPDGDGRLDDHQSPRVDLLHQPDDLLDVCGVEEVPLAVVVRRGCDDHYVGFPVRTLPVERRLQVQGLLRQVALDVLVLYRRLPPVYLIHLLGYHVHRRHMVPLRQERRQRQPHVARPGHCYPCSHFCLILIVLNPQSPPLGILLLLYSNPAHRTGSVGFCIPGRFPS